MTLNAFSGPRSKLRERQRCRRSAFHEGSARGFLHVIYISSMGGTISSVQQSGSSFSRSLVSRRSEILTMGNVRSEPDCHWGKVNGVAQSSTVCGSVSRAARAHWPTVPLSAFASRSRRCVTIFRNRIYRFNGTPRCRSTVRSQNGLGVIETRRRKFFAILEIQRYFFY